MSSKNDVYYLWVEVLCESIKLPLKDILQDLIREYIKQEDADVPQNKIFGYNETYITSKVKNLTQKNTNKAYSPQILVNTFLKLALSVSDDIYSKSKLTLKSVNVVENYIEKQQTILNRI